MGAPKGHPLWGNPIKPKKYTPEKLWEKAIEYFEWCNNNPIIVTEQSKMPQRLDSTMVKSMKPAMIKAFLKQTIEMPLYRAYSLEGLCNFADINFQTFLNYESDEYNKNDKTYFEVCSRVRKIIDQQHFEGGMAGIYNANIVTRKLGLAERTESKNNITISPMNQDERNELDKLFNEEN